MDKEILEGWNVQDFVNELQMQADLIMIGQSWHKPFANRKELAEWCADNQPYYKEIIPEVVQYFADRYGIG